MLATQSDTRAREYGLITRTSARPQANGTKERSPRLVAWEGWAFARYFCDVEHDRHHVTIKRHTFLD